MKIAPDFPSALTGHLRQLGSILAIVCLAAACVSGSAQTPASADREFFPSTYAPEAPMDVLIRNATILDGAGNRFRKGSILLRAGRIEAVGSGLKAPSGVPVIDAEGRYVTPGIIDPHTHLGNATPPFFDEEIEVWDVNEQSSTLNAHLRAETSLRTQDPAFSRLRAAGVTTIQILPGSSSLFGGQGVVVRTRDAVTIQDIKFPEASRSLKIACGENPKHSGEADHRYPTSRMGSVSKQREQFALAKKAAASGEIPSRLQPLVDLMRGEMRAHIHCYTSDDMAVLLEVAREFDFQITAFHHAAEAYKIADRLADTQTCAVVWSDWWGFKREIFDGIRANAAILEKAGVCVALHSDSSILGQRLPVEAAKAMAAGQRAGIPVAPEEALAWITLNPARMLGIDAETGSLEAGKRADVVLWSGDPFSIYTLADLVFIDGVPVYDRSAAAGAHLSDFELGQPVLEGVE